MENNKDITLRKFLFGTYTKIPDDLDDDSRLISLSIPTFNGGSKNINIRKDEGIIEYLELRIQQLEEQVRILNIKNK